MQTPYAGWIGARRTDIILAVAVAGTLALIIALAQTDANSPVLVLSYAFAAGFGAILLLRRTVPRTVAVLSVLGTFAYYSLDLTPIGVALPVAAALYSLAEVGLTRFAVIAALVVFVVSTAFRIRDDLLPLGRLLGAESISTITLMSAAIILGYAMNTHRRFVAEQAEVLRLQDERLREEADARIQRERMAISRDLHDTLGHSLSVISLHTNVGLEALGRVDAVAGRPQIPGTLAALQRIRQEATRSLTELRSMVKLLRTEREDSQVTLDISGVAGLLARAHDAGLSVDSQIDLEPGAVPSPIETFVFRVVQEGITNVVKHSGAHTVTVRVGLGESEVSASVVDDGIGDDAQHRPLNRGHGLQGLHERARLLGGSLSTSSPSGAGFSLEARVPRRLPA